MATLQNRTLSNRTVERLKAEKDTVFWDRELTGFGVRVYPTGGKIYVVQARGPGGPKRVTVGRHGVLGAEQARRRAALIIARVKAGEAPAPEPTAAREAGGPTVEELARRYLEEHVAVRYKPGAAASARTVVNRHIVPAFGKLPLAAVERAQVTELHHRLCETPFVANMMVATLSLMYRLAEGWGMAPEGCNPCRCIVKYPERKRERFLTDGEFDRLGKVLDEAGTRGGASAPAVAAIRLLMLTGCRKSEILGLRWEDVAFDADELRLPDAKTGARAVPLSPSAVKLLAGLPRVPGNPWVIPGRKPGTHLRDLDDAWKILRARAGLDDVRIHDLRHSFASRALALGESLPMIGKLLGHGKIETTARYAHLARVMDAGYTIFPSIILERQQALGLEPVDVNILLHLAQHWWEKDNAPHPSKKSIAAAVGVHPRTVQRRIAAMESGGLIRREERRTASNTSKTNLYHFDGLVEAATPYAEEALQERERRRKEDSERITRRGRPRLRVVSQED